MPVITVDGAKLPKEKKAELIAELTETASRIMGIPAEKYIVYVKENDMDNIGVGGKVLSEIKKGE